MQTNRHELLEKKLITQADILQTHHKFLRESDSQNSEEEQSNSRQRSRNKNKRNTYEEYGQDMAKRYYNKLYKQFVLVNLQKYQTGQIGCRWRSYKQVLAKKGQKYCAQIHCNQQSEQTYEMNFGYRENGEKKNALVKVCVCGQCSKKLNYKKQLKKIKHEGELESDKHHKRDQSIPQKQ